MEDAFQHDERDDQNADREQDTAGTHYVILCDKTISSSREVGTLCDSGGCHVLIAQVHQAALERKRAALGQSENHGGDTDDGTYCSVALAQVLERHVESQEDDHGQDTGPHKQYLFE